jgi:hypothetical protein
MEAPAQNNFKLLYDTLGKENNWPYLGALT